MFNIEDPNLSLIFLITLGALVLSSAVVIFNDFKKMKIPFWQLLLFIAVGYIGVVLSQVLFMNFNPALLVFIPVFLLLEVFNFNFAKNKYIGQADLDIVNGIISMSVIFVICLWIQTPDGVYKTQGFMTNLISYFSTCCVAIVVGHLIAAFIGFTSRYISYKKGEKVGSIKTTKVPACIGWIPAYIWSSLIMISLLGG